MKGIRAIVLLAVGGGILAASPQGAPPPPVAYWKLDELSGTQSDSTPTGLVGTHVGGVQIVTTNLPPIQFSNPARLQFDGTGSVDFGNPASLPDGTSPRSMAAWGLTTVTTGGYRWMAAYGTPNTGQAMFLGMYDEYLVAGGYGGDDLEVWPFWTPNVWHHVALTYDGTTAKLYADGQLLLSAPKSWNLVRDKAYLGVQVHGTEWWNGLVDDVRIYDRVLSAGEIATLAAGVEPPDVTAPVVTFVSPTGPTTTAPAGTLDVQGTATDAVGVTSLVWSNAATGQAGTIATPASWTVPIPVVAGTNVITVTATDASGNVGSSVLTVNPAAAAPATVVIEEDDSRCSWASTRPGGARLLWAAFLLLGAIALAAGRR